MKLLILLPLVLAMLPARSADDATTSLGRLRAQASPLEWEIREAGHPILGNIRFAFLKKPFETLVGKQKVYSGAYLSCQRATRTIAIELTNTVAPTDPGGLKPNRMPRLVCRKPAARGDDRIVQEELPVKWEVNEIGDALARGFDAAPLRACAGIGIVQDVILPATWPQKTAQVIFELPPYNRQLDSIFTTCGEVTAYPPAGPLVGMRPDTDAAWRTARVISEGRTNVRRGPSTQSPLVVQLDPGQLVLVQKTRTDWWRVRSRSGPAFEGYVREDRLVLP